MGGVVALKEAIRHDSYHGWEDTCTITLSAYLDHRSVYIDTVIRRDQRRWKPLMRLAATAFCLYDRGGHSQTGNKALAFQPYSRRSHCVTLTTLYSFRRRQSFLQYLLHPVLACLAILHVMHCDRCLLRLSLPCGSIFQT